MNELIEFKAYPKTPRLFRDVVITEKIDGTNAAVCIVDAPYAVGAGQVCEAGIVTDERTALVYAQSRKRIIEPGDDNAGFAKWVRDNADTLARDLGPGVHYGEWWGSKIQRGYGRANGSRTFSLFNVNRYEEMIFPETPGLSVVPVLHEGPFSEETVRTALGCLTRYGSLAQPGYRDPEGIVVYHTAARQSFKVLIENDAHPKGAAA